MGLGSGGVLVSHRDQDLVTDSEYPQGQRGAGVKDPVSDHLTGQQSQVFRRLSAQGAGHLANKRPGPGGRTWLGSEREMGRAGQPGGQVEPHELEHRIATHPRVMPPEGAVQK